MGEDKSQLLFGGRTLVDLTREKLKRVANEVRIVGPKKKFGDEALEDVFVERGPLGGIHAALVSSPVELNLALAVDLPFVQEDLLRYLIQEGMQSDAVAVVPKTVDGFQPLCALYRNSFAKNAEGALRDGRNKIDALFSEVPVRVIDETELARAGIAVEQFRNVNTRADLEAARMHFVAQ
jgi:molybdopterin-guanine dinucleotide biosynthesis protein A